MPTSPSKSSGGLTPSSRPTAKYASAFSRGSGPHHPDLIRTKINLLPEGVEQIRVIEIVGLDLQADGGTNVARTREVGTIRVVGHESKGRIDKRLRLAIEL